MQMVNVELEHCYGIHKLQRVFDFKEQRVFAIYAPNGTMKTSFARTFEDIANGSQPSDRIFPGRATVCNVTDEEGNQLSSQRVFVIRPYDRDYVHSDKASVLLVNPKLRQEYRDLLTGIDRAEKALIAAVKQQAGTKRDMAIEISDTFTQSPDQLERALTRIKAELDEDLPFAKVQYDKLFDQAVVDFLSTKEAQVAIVEYITRYNELLAKSVFFKRGTFEHWNAAQIASALAKHGFFKAKHSVTLNSSGQSELITDEKQLERVIAREKEEILSDEVLRQRFNVLGDRLDKNETLRGLRTYLRDNEYIVPELSNMGVFRQKLLKSYIVTVLDKYNDVLKEYETAKARKKEIEDDAIAQRTKWEAVISEFKDRFTVPFNIEVKNLLKVMLKEEPIELQFQYIDGDEKETVSKTKLQDTLSQGELKALYVLNIIFEVRTQLELGVETLMVVDDIADSFDYQNKYAIIHYLKEISDNKLFKLIILTHNFDFFRTLKSRFVRYDNCLMAIRDQDRIVLDKASGINNIFATDWKIKFFEDDTKKIASIPFMRNLIEYIDDKQAADYKELTSMLHWKPKSGDITVGQLDAVFNRLFRGTNNSANADQAVIELMHQRAEHSLGAPVGTNFEGKIVLAMSIRLHAEEYMVNRIADKAFWESLDHKDHQTANLFAEFKSRYPNDPATSVLDRVIIMTPENIHLNAFMYEPIVDMSIEQLRRLHEAVVGLRLPAASV